MNRTSQPDVHSYYRQITEVDIGDVTRDLLAARVTAAPAFGRMRRKESPRERRHH